MVTLKSRKTKLVTNKELEEMESQQDKCRRVFCRVCAEIIHSLENKKHDKKIRESAENILYLMNKDTRKCISAVLEEFNFYALHILRLGDSDNKPSVFDDSLSTRLTRIIRSYQMECYSDMQKIYTAMLEKKHNRTVNNQIHDVLALQVYAYHHLGVLFDDVDDFTTADQYSRDLMEDEIKVLRDGFNKKFNVEMLESENCPLYSKVSDILGSEEDFRDLMIYFFEGCQPIIAPDLPEKESILARVFPTAEQTGQWKIEPGYFIHLCQSCGLLRHRTKKQ